jgi:hypothetical protein
MAYILPTYKPKGFKNPITNVYATLTEESKANLKKGVTSLIWWVYENQAYYEELRDNTEEVANPLFGQTGEPETITQARPLHFSPSYIIGKIELRVEPADFGVIALNTDALSESNVKNAYIKSIYTWANTKSPFSATGVSSVME